MTKENELIDTAYYWVLFSDRWEIAQYDKEVNRFKFTSGGRAEPSWCKDYETNPILRLTNG